MLDGQSCPVRSGVRNVVSGLLHLGHSSVPVIDYLGSTDEHVVRADLSRSNDSPVVAAVDSVRKEIVVDRGAIEDE